MSMDRPILYQKIEKALKRFNGTANFDLNLILWLIRKVIFNDPTQNCVIRGRKENWQGLPKTKSLFFARENRGLPIGNLTSQLFGNVYLNDFDHFVKHRLGMKYYGRYVDDIVIAHEDKEYLKSIIPILREYLQNQLSLELHPDKVYLQYFSRGVNFLGTVIKPYRIYIQNRVKGNFYRKIRYWNNFLSRKGHQLTGADAKQFLSSINSYLGIMKHYHTYKLRRKMITENLLPDFSNYVYTVNNYGKFVSKI